MKLLISVIIIAPLTHIAQTLGPWWIGAACAFVVMLMIRMKPGHALIAGFIGVGAAWTAASIWIDMQNHEILSTRVAEMFQASRPVILLSTSVIGGLTGALGALTGSYAARMVKSEAQEEDADQRPLLG